MASTYHFSSQPVPAGKTASAHFDYIYREGRYDPQKFGEDDIRAIGEGNMPEWAHTPDEFWSASDRFGRANGRAYREINIALQNELGLEDNIQLVEDFIAESGIANEHAYVYAIHSRRSIDGTQKNIHAHIMFNEKIVEHDRPLDRYDYFRNYAVNAAGEPTCGYRTSTKHSSKQGILADRYLWESIVNRKFRERNMDERVSAKSLKAQRADMLEQGRFEEASLLDRTPAPHVGSLLKHKGNAEKVREYVRQFLQEAEAKESEDKAMDAAEATKEEQQPETVDVAIYNYEEEEKAKKRRAKLKTTRDELEKIENTNEKLLAIYAHDYVVRQLARKIQKERLEAVEKAVEKEADKLAKADLNVTVGDISNALEKRRSELGPMVVDLRNRYSEIKKHRIPEEHIHSVALNHITNGEYDRLRKQIPALEKKLDAVHDEAKKLFPEYYSHGTKYYIEHPEERKRLWPPVNDWLQVNEPPVLRAQDKVQWRLDDINNMIKTNKTAYNDAVVAIRADNEKLNVEIKKLSVEYGKIKNQEKRINQLQAELSHFDQSRILFAGKVNRILTKNDKIDGKTPVRTMERFVHDGNEYYITASHGGGKQGGYETAVRLHDDVTAGSVPTYAILYHYDGSFKEVMPVEDRTKLYAGRATTKDNAFRASPNEKGDVALPSSRDILDKSPAVQEAKTYRTAQTVSLAVHSVAGILGNNKKETANKHTKLHFRKDDGNLSEIERLIRQALADEADITEDLPDHKSKIDALKEVSNAIAAFRGHRRRERQTGEGNVKEAVPSFQNSKRPRRESPQSKSFTL
ncbi:MAG: MobA/MobL family protein [Succiniclasticum sp.]|nr:MobA/MobL family protein [Succiniclasticum sp.]